jgi:hypothetical protein
MDEMPIELVRKISGHVKQAIDPAGAGISTSINSESGALNKLAFLALVFVDGLCDLAIAAHDAKK